MDCNEGNVLEISKQVSASSRYAPKYTGPTSQAPKDGDEGHRCPVFGVNDRCMDVQPLVPTPIMIIISIRNDTPWIYEFQRFTGLELCLRESVVVWLRHASP